MKTQKTTYVKGTDYALWLAEFRATNATPWEFNAVLGTSRWALCRKTARNLARYERCLTRKEYDEANREAIRRRTEN
jgi:hypothetical protein